MQLFFGSPIAMSMEFSPYLETPVVQRVTRIAREPQKLLTPEQELALVREAYDRSRSPELRSRLASMLVLQEEFESVIELLSHSGPPNYLDKLCLALACLSVQTDHGNRQATDAAQAAFDIATNDTQRAEALAYRGKAEIRMGQADAAVRTLKEALRLDPTNKDACKRIAAIELGRDASDELLQIIHDLHEAGANHARLWSAKALGEARAGDSASARRTIGLDDLLFNETLDPPEGWPSQDEFNAALAQELVRHPCLRYERYGSASEKTWRVEAPLRRDTPALNALVGLIESRLHRIVEKVANSDHPWAKALPAESFLRCWSVITESTGFENWHVHQFGWLSGVYYVQVPDSIANGTSENGCLAFGLPDDLAGAAGSMAFGETLVRPRPGMMLTFPSHCYHRTYPHGTGEQRICFAFDLRPA